MVFVIDYNLALAAPVYHLQVINKIIMPAVLQLPDL